MAKTKSNVQQRYYVFNRQTSIGKADAADDERFLANTFVDNGYLEVLQDTSDSQSIVVGRTGSGKTAMLLELKRSEERSVILDIESLALTYITNSGVINHLIEAGVEMDLFYKFLWRHIFIVESLRRHLRDEEEGKTLLQSLKKKFQRDGKKGKPLEYLSQYGSSLWIDTDRVVQGVVENVERQFDAAVGGKLEVPATTTIDSRFSTQSSVSEETSLVIRERGQKIIQEMQLAHLSRLLEIVDEEVFTDSQKKYFLLIDRLDEGWVNESLKYPLIAALLESAKDFNNRVSNAKVVVALREDLIERVFRYVRKSGYQSEKYESLKVRLYWTDDDLEEIADRRISYLIREQYRDQEVRLYDLLPDTIKEGREEKNSVQYILDRTMQRPRDLIAFINEALRAADGKTLIKKADLSTAETRYSEGRLDALRDEFPHDYPNLVRFVLCLVDFPKQFKYPDVSERLHEEILKILCERPAEVKADGKAYRDLEALFNEGNEEGLTKELLRILHRVGVLGVKSHTAQAVVWSYSAHFVEHFNEKSMFHIHRSLWRKLNIKP